MTVFPSPIGFNGAHNQLGGGAVGERQSGFFVAGDVWMHTRRASLRRRRPVQAATVCERRAAMR